MPSRILTAMQANNFDITMRGYFREFSSFLLLTERKSNEGRIWHIPKALRHEHSLDEFLLRGERGESATYATGGQNIAEREKNAYKYAIDLFLMYISQETTPNILPNKAISNKAAEVKAKLLSNPKNKSSSR